MTKEQLIDFYLRNNELFNNNDIVVSMLRGVGWFFFELLVKLAAACEYLYDISYGLVDFSSWPKVNQFVDTFKPLFIALMAVSIFALGIILIMDHEKKPKIIINICIAILCVTCSTLVFSQLNQIAKDLKSGIEAVGTVDEEDDGVYDIVSTHLFDIYQIDQKIGMSNIDYGENGKGLPHPKMDKQRLSVLDYSEVLDYESGDYEFQDDAAEDILSQKLVSLGDGENYAVKDVYNGALWTSVGNTFYFRYKLDALPAVMELVAVMLLYIALSYKCTRLAFELVFARLLAYLYAAELSGGQKIAKILTFIRDTYILLVITTLCVKVYYLFNAYINEHIENSLVQGFLILFVAFAVIDGPNLVEKLLGMDAGLKSSTARMMAAYGMMRSAARTAMAPGKMAYGYHRQNVMMGRQADATAAAMRNAADLSQTGAGTGFMDGDADKDKAADGEQQEGNPASQHAADDGADAYAQTDGRNEGIPEDGGNGSARNPDQEFNDTGFMEQADQDNMSAMNEESEAGQNDTHRQEEEAGIRTDFMEEDHGNQASGPAPSDGTTEPAGERMERMDRAENEPARTEREGGPSLRHGDREEESYWDHFMNRDTDSRDRESSFRPRNTRTADSILDRSFRNRRGEDEE